APVDGEDEAPNATLAILLAETLDFGVDRLGDLLGDEPPRVPGEITEQERSEQGEYRQIDERQFERGRAEELAERTHARPHGPHQPGPRAHVAFGPALDRPAAGCLRARHGNLIFG